MIFSYEDIVSRIIDIIFQNYKNICKKNPEYLLYFNTSSINILFFNTIKNKFNVDCKKYIFNNIIYCIKHQPVEVKLCRYLNNISINDDINKNLVQLGLQSFKGNEIYSFHLSYNDNNLNLKEIFEKVAFNTKFTFSHSCCRGKGIMFEYNK